MTDPQTTDRVIGRYTILGKLGEGGMAEVFLARSKGAGGIDKTLVIKRIHPVLAKNKRFIDMFMEEARVAMRLNHSNVVQVYAFEQIQDDYVLAMEHVDGSDLLDIQTLAYNEGCRIPFGFCAFIAAEIAKGLDYAHSRKDERGVPIDLVHRDVSPQNILVSRDGGVKVTDFGIVKARYVHEEVGEIKGKLGYMSPQQARGLSVDRRADVFSLGVVLHEMLVGASRQRPVPGEAVRLPPPILVDSTVPGMLSDITIRALAHNVEDRYQNAREMAIDLNNYLRTEPGIYDSTAFGEWIAATVPSEKLIKVKLESRIDTDATQITSDDLTHSHLNAIGNVEQQAVIMVSAQMRIEDSRRSAWLQKEVRRLTEEIVYKYGGIIRYQQDRFRMFLGLPTSSFEDSFSAIRMGHDILDVVQTLGTDNRCHMAARISVNRGTVRVARTEVDQPLLFEPEPATIQLSDLLLENGEDNSVISGQGVYDIARPDYHFGQPIIMEYDTQVTDDGTRTTLGYPVFRAKNRTERSASEPSGEEVFTGREAELRQMCEAFDRSRTGQPILLRITGELGLGKSSLIRQFSQFAQRSGCTVIRSECLFAERETSLAGAAAVIRSLLGIEETFSQQVLLDVLNGLFSKAPHYRDRQCAFLGELVASPQSVWDRFASRQRDLIRQCAFGIGVLITRLSENNRLCLVVDNAQWLDGPSVDVLSDLAQNMLAIPTMVVLAGQPETLAERHIEHLVSIELGELSDEAMTQLIIARIGTAKDIADVAQRILERAHGNPFFANEIIASLISRGILKRAGTTAEGAPVYTQVRAGVLELPTTVKGIAESRINTLTAEQRTVLRAAAVVYSGVTRLLLERLIGREIGTDLDILVEKGFLTAVRSLDTEGRNEATQYHFKRAVEREAAYEGLTAADRSQLHQKTARRLMKQAEGGVSVPPVTIAWHLDNSNQPALAADYYLKAATGAMTVYSARRALRLLDRVLDLMPRESRKRFDVLFRKERVLRDIGRHDIHTETLQEMAALGNHFDDDGMRSIAAYRMARHHYNDGDFQQSAARLDDAIRYAQSAQDRNTAVESLRALGYLAIEAGDLDRAMDCATWGRSMVSDEPDDLYLKARILGLKGLVMMEIGHLGRAAYPLVFAMVSFHRLGDRRNESVQLANLGLLAQARGHLLDAIGFFERALSIDRQIRDVSERGRKMVGYADIRVELGQFDTGHSLLNEALNICRKNNEPLGELEALHGMAEFRLQQGNTAEALHILENLPSPQFITDSAILRSQHLRLLTETLIENGNPAAAISHAGQYIDFAERAQMRSEHVHARSLLALALSATGDSEGVRREIRLVEELADDLGLVRHAERFWWRCARAFHRSGHMAERDRVANRARQEIHRKAGYIDSPRHSDLFHRHPLIDNILNGRYD